jgi:hypothetical protein
MSKRKGISQKMLRINLSREDLLKVALVGGTVIFLAGCNQMIAPNLQNEGTASPIETRPSLASPTEGNTQMTPSLPTPADIGLQNLIDKAITDLAQRLTISANEIILLEATSVVWPDSSLGCPQEGMAYAQVLTPGYLIRLESGNHEFEYHASKGTHIFYCENPSSPILGTPANT